MHLFIEKWFVNLISLQICLRPVAVDDVLRFEKSNLWKYILTCFRDRICLSHPNRNKERFIFCGWLLKMVENVAQIVLADLSLNTSMWCKRTLLLCTKEDPVFIQQLKTPQTSTNCSDVSYGPWKAPTNTSTYASHQGRPWRCRSKCYLQPNVQSIHPWAIEKPKPSIRQFRKCRRGIPSFGK